MFNHIAVMPEMQHTLASVLRKTENTIHPFVFIIYIGLGLFCSDCTPVKVHVMVQEMVEVTMHTFILKGISVRIVVVYAICLIHYHDLAG